VNLLKNKLQRTAAVLGGALLGLGGVVAIAAPASAHAPSVDGSTDCIRDKSWTVDWSVGNDYQLDAKVDLTKTKVEVKSGHGEWKKVDGGLTGALADAATVVKPNTDRKPDEQVHGATTISTESVTDVRLSVVLVWTDGYTNDGEHRNGDPQTKTVHKPETCPTDNPSTPENPTPSSSAPSSPSTTTPSSPTPSETTPEIPIPTPSTSDEPVEPKEILEFTCDTLVIGLDNPVGGTTFTLKFKTSKGEERTTVIKPGEKKTETFSATEGFSLRVTVEVTIDGETYSDFTDIEYEKPADCEGSGGGLPVTGAAAGGIAGGAAGLLAIGAVLFVMARRRKVRFTA
jgi:hypothetical protein